MLSTEKSTTNGAKPPKTEIPLTPEATLTILTRALSIMREAGAIVQTQDRAGTLYLRIRFRGMEIVPVNEDDDGLYFKIVPIVAQAARNE